MQNNEGRIPQVSEYLDRLGNELDKLDKSTAELRERLQPVLRSVPPVDSVGVPKAEKENLVQLADRINSNVYRVSNMVDSVRALIELLEL